MFRTRQGRAGFTIIEAMIVIAIVSVLAGIMIPRFLRIRGQADLAVVLDQIKDVQGIAMIHYSETAMAPTIEQLDAAYSRNGHGSLIGRYAVVPVAGQGGSAPMKMAQPGEDGYEPQRYVICSLMPIKGYSYVYGLDDNPPMVAGLGADPVGSSVCGSSESSSSGGPASPGEETSPPDDGGNGSGSGGETGNSPGEEAAPPDSGQNGSGNGSGNGGGESGPGEETAPPDSGETGATTPDEPATPPDEPAIPPEDNGNGSGNGGNESTPDPGPENTGEVAGDDDDEGTGSSGETSDCDIDHECPPNKHWKNHGEYSSCIAHAKKECEEKVNHGQMHKDGEGDCSGHH